jgi:hypothetical protein
VRCLVAPPINGLRHGNQSPSEKAENWTLLRPKDVFPSRTKFLIMTQSVEQTNWQHYYRRTDEKTNSKNDTAYLLACQCPLMKYRSSSLRSNDGIYYLRMNFPVHTQAQTIQKSSHPRALTIHSRVHNLAIMNTVGSTINKMLPSTSSCATLGGLTRFTTSPSGGDAAIIGALETSGAMVIEPCRALWI